MHEKNKKAISEIVSYVLLIVIALGLAVLVFSWLKFYVPGQDREKCSDDISLFLNDYTCYTDANDRIISINIENKGFFNVDGFFIRASNDTDKLPFLTLNSTNSNLSKLGAGRYDFNFFGGPLKPQQRVYANFSYPSTSDPTYSIKRIQIQPYVLSNKTRRTLLCSNIIDLRLENC